MTVFSRYHTDNAPDFDHRHLLAARPAIVAGMWILLLLAPACSSGDSLSEDPPAPDLKDRVYVISEQSDEMFVADLRALSEVGSVNTRIGEGVNANHMAMISKDQSKIYVSATHKDALVVVDARTLRVQKTISAGAHPTHMGMCEGCGMLGQDELWVINEGGEHDDDAAVPGSISIIDTARDEVVQTLSHESMVVPHFVRFSGGSAYIPSIGGNQVTVLDVATRQVTDVLVLGGATAGACSGDPCGFADAQIDPDGLLMAAHIETGSVLVYDTLARERKPDIGGGSQPWAVFVDVLDNSFSTQLMPNWRDSSVSLLDRKTLIEVARSPEGDLESYGVNYSPLAPGLAFVLNRLKERVAVIDRRTGILVDALDVGGTTETATTTDDGRYLLLPLSSAGAFAVWDIPEREEVMRFEGVGQYPWSVTTIGGQNYCH
jgi:YVTN family beta-propeller protein